MPRRLKGKKAVAAIGLVTCAVGAGGVGIVQAQSGEGGDDPRELATGFTVQPILGERTIDLVKDVPPHVRHTAEQASRGADFNRAQIDFDNIEVEYELQGTTSEGQTVEIDVNPSGRLVEIEEQIRRKDVPRAALQLLKRQFPGVEVTKFERSTRPTDIGLLRVFYEFDTKGGRGGDLDIEINQRGTVATLEPLEAQRPAPGLETPPAGGQTGSPG